jgi:hypothetical protein
VIEAFVLARLLRIRLLTLEATVMVVPAEVDGANVTPVSAANGRRGLAEAVRTIEEGAAILAEVRRTAAASRRG